MVKTILIISSDDEYNISIEHRLSSSLNENVRFDLISDPEYLITYLKSPHNINVLIIDPALGRYINTAIKSDKAYILTESATTKDGEISKYGGADSIIRELDESFLKKSLDDKVRGDAKIIGVCSPSGGSGKTVSSIGLCLRLSEMGKKVLYINAESFQTFDSVIGKSGAFTGGMVSYMTDDVKRAIAAGSPNACNVILANVRKGKFDYIPQSMDILSSYQITEDKLFSIAKQFKAVKAYDYIVVEFESGLSAPRQAFLSECDRVLIVSKQDKEAADRLKRFVKIMGGSLNEVFVICARCRADQANEIYSLDILSSDRICEYIPEKSDIAEIFKSEEGIYYKKSAEAVL